VLSLESIFTSIGRFQKQIEYLTKHLIMCAAYYKQLG